MPPLVSGGECDHVTWAEAAEGQVGQQQLHLPAQTTVSCAFQSPAPECDRACAQPAAGKDIGDQEGDILPTGFLHHFFPYIFSGSRGTESGPWIALVEPNLQLCLLCILLFKSE